MPVSSKYYVGTSHRHPLQGYPIDIPTPKLGDLLLITCPARKWYPSSAGDCPINGSPTSTWPSSLFPRLFSGGDCPLSPLSPNLLLVSPSLSTPFDNGALTRAITRPIRKSVKGMPVGLVQLLIALVVICPSSSAAFFSQVTLLLKKGDPLQASNYRQIAIIPQLRKLYESVLLQLLRSSSHAVCRPLQCGS